MDWMKNYHLVNQLSRGETMKKILIFSFLLVMSLTACQNKEIRVEDIAEDDSKYFIETLEYRSDETIEVPDKKENDGKTYKFLNYEDKEIGIEKGYDIETYVVEETDVVKEDAKFPETKIVSGNEYEFKEVDYKKGNVRKETLKIDVQFIDETPTESYVAKYFDEKSGKDIEVTYELIGFTTSSRWVDDLQMPITVYDYDSYAYQIGNSIVTATDSDIYIAGAETDILASEGMNTSMYQLFGAYWNGEPYDNNGVLQRNAIAYGSRLQYEYAAHYEAKVELPELNDAEVVYERKVENPSKDVTIFERTIIYEHEIISPVIVFSIGLAMILAFILLFLFKAKNKKERKDRK